MSEVARSLGAPFKWWVWLAAAIALLFLVHSGGRLELHRLILGPGVQQQAPAAHEDSLLSAAFPPAIAKRTPVDTITDFDPSALPFFARLVTETTQSQSIDPETFQVIAVKESRQVLVEPFGYLADVVVQMISTIELAIWATLLALLVSLPLALLGAKNTAPLPGVRIAVRPLVAFLRAVPELVSALIFVLIFGFGPLAGIAALGLHSAGFLAKFFAEDIENASPHAQEALRGFGLSRLTTFRLAIVPETLPSFTALTLYILDRNVRMATVVGLVGAGGIGQELKGRYDLFQFDHVLTVVLVIFISVVMIDALCAWLKRRIA